VVDLKPLVEQARRSELFTAPRLEADLARFLAERTGQIKAFAAEAISGGVEHVPNPWSEQAQASVHWCQCVSLFSRRVCACSGR
jgi:hypothetical protein